MIRITNFKHFLAIAQKHISLIIALCAEHDIISRARMLNYLEQQGISPAEKDRVIDALCRTAVLLVEAEQSYTVNPVIADLVNYYERRGRLTSATFLRDQIITIAKLTDVLQQYLVADEQQPQLILDTLDDLYRLVREVREAGDGHYMACMRLFGNMKRTGDTQPIDQRIQELQTAQRRHITPLRELIDPSAEYARKIRSLHQRMLELSTQVTLLTQSQELDNRRQRLLMDLRYIDRVLLHNFGTIEHTALALLQSLLKEKHIKDAVAACLGDLKTTWAMLASTTVISVRQQAIQAPPLETQVEFFADVIHKRLLPNPRPLTVPDVQHSTIEQHLVRKAQIWAHIKATSTITSWPSFVVVHFGQYSAREQLRAIALPLIVYHKHIQVIRHDTTFEHSFDIFHVHMHDFALKWS